MSKYILYLFVFFCFSCTSKSKHGKIQNEINVDTIGNFFQLQGDIKKVLGLKNIKLIDELKTDKNVWFILEGIISEPTYEDAGIFIYPAKKEGKLDTIYLNKYSYPGQEFSFDEQLQYESRVFYGACTKNHQNSIIWFQRELREEEWDTSYFVIDFLGNSISSTEDSNIHIKEVLTNIEKNLCKEIPGKVQYDEP